MKTVQWKGHQKIVRLRNGSALQLPLSACVTVGETIRSDRNGTFVDCQNGLARLLPIYAARDVVKIGSVKLDLLFKEITEAEEFEAYRALTSFHYRDQPLFGRTARLIVQAFHPNYPRVIGYVELAMPFYMSKPRNAILNRPFRSGSIHWEQWDRKTASQYINVMARIARCVVYPEFRGLGLGQTLVAHAREFAKTRWQVAGLKPQFIEISADMLKYVPFAEKAGLQFIGETEGNLDRVATDLEYLLSNKRRVKSGKIVREEAFGIVDQQVARMDRASALMRENGWSLPDLLSKLKRLRHSTSLRDLSLFQQILSLPKPTYLGGLSIEAERFVKEGVRRLRPDRTLAALPPVPKLAGTISFRRLTIVHKSAVQRSQHTSAIQQAFGISPEEITHQVIRDLSFSIEPGQIAMIVGPSGSGKTTLLRHLATTRPMANGRSGIRLPKHSRPGLFQPMQSNRPLIDALGASSVASALQLMGIVSLSDAFVYLKRFDELSAGQQYRAMLAKLIAGRHNIWIADEFGVNLDLLAANCVAHRLGQIVRELKVALIVATPQPEATAKSLLPDVVVRLTTAWEREVLTGREFLSRLPKTPRFRIPSLSLPSATRHRILNGRKSAIALLPDAAKIRSGAIAVETNGALMLCSASQLDTALYSKVPIDLIRRAGYKTKGQFVRSWRRQHSDPNEKTSVSVFELKPLKILLD